MRISSKFYEATGERRRENDVYLELLQQDPWKAVELFVTENRNLLYWNAQNFCEIYEAPSEEDDLVQEATLAIYEKLDTFDPERGSFRGFASTALRRLMHRDVRRAHRRNTLEHKSAVYDDDGNAVQSFDDFCNDQNAIDELNERKSEPSVDLMVQWANGTDREQLMYRIMILRTTEQPNGKVLTQREVAPMIGLSHARVDDYEQEALDKIEVAAGLPPRKKRNQEKRGGADDGKEYTITMEKTPELRKIVGRCVTDMTDAQIKILIHFFKLDSRYPKTQKGLMDRLGMSNRYYHKFVADFRNVSRSPQKASVA